MKAIKDMPEHSRPREKLREKGAAALTDEELVAAILGMGMAGIDVRTMSRQVAGLIQAHRESLTLDHLIAVPGMGLAKAAQILSAFELARRHLLKESRKIESADGIEKNFPKAYSTRETADLFLVLIVHLLREEGRGAIVLPDGTLFGEGIKTRIKEKLLTECNLHTIVRLPNGVFSPYTGIKTNLLFFTKGQATKDVWYYEHPYPAGVKSYNKTKPIRIEEFEAEKAWWTNRVENERAWRVSFETIAENNFNLDIKNPNAPDEVHGDFDELLAAHNKIMRELADTRDMLKDELMKALRATADTNAANS